MKGVIGVYTRDNLARKALYMLYGVQHRGQESSGISAAGDHSLRTWNGRGLVSNVFDERYRSFIHPDDYVAVGCTSGEKTDNIKLPPLELENDRYELSVTMDGHIPGHGDVLSEEVIGRTLMAELQEQGGVEEALSRTMRGLEDAYYSLVIALHDKELDRSELLAARDRFGIRPLFMGLNDSYLFIASESAPIDVLESMGESVHEKMDFTPGSIIRHSDEGFTQSQVMEPTPTHCAFEWVYFGRPDSVIESRNVHTVRKRLGHALVETHSLRETYGVEGGDSKDIVVIPVPDSGRSVCIGVAEALGVAADEGVIKNAYLGRTYIIHDTNFRKIASDLKHNIIKKTVEGKKVVITDDSIVRGTVSESIAQNLLKAGASQVEFLVSYAPIFYPCFSDPEDKPLTAAPYKGMSLEEIGELVASKLPSITRVRYNSPENIVTAIDLPEGRICTHCITGRTPFHEGKDRRTEA
jgi:amidophosphoribosyltransferase